jgi:transmembrane sensor
MSNQGSNLQLRRIYREAVFWDWQLQDPDIPDSEFERFMEWHAVPAHQEALDAVAAIRERSHQMTPGSGVSAPPAPPLSLSLPTSLLALAAVVLLAVLILRPEIVLEIGPSTRTLRTQATASASSFGGESIVRMARHTELTLTVGKHERSSYLKRGRAFFHVAHDPARPFVVQTPVAVVTVVGTQFDVANDDGASVVITVLDGTVAVSPVHSGEVSLASAPREQIYLHAGEQIRVSSHGESFLSCVDSAKELDWATMIEFPRTPIGQAIEQFSRRSGFRLALENPGIARKAALSGPFQLDDPQGFAQHAANKAQATVLLYGPGSTVERVAPQAGQLREERQ